MLDALENIATYGDDRVPLQWIIEEEDSEESVRNISAGEVLLVIDDHAKMLVKYLGDLFKYMHEELKDG
jgi:hypothetical protein